MHKTAIAVAVLGFCAVTGAAIAAPKTPDNPNGCRVIERKDGAPPGAISSSVTAGGGHVSASTSGGNGVSVMTSNGGGGSVATARTSGGNGISTMVTTGNGNCTIYVDPGDRKGDQK